jgi:hypothetical protein
MKVSKAKAVDTLYKEIEGGKGYKETKGLLMAELGVGKNTFDSYWKEAKARFEKRVQKTDELAAKKQAERILLAIETKDGQVEALNKQLIEITNEIESGLTVEWTWKGDQYVETVRPMNANEKKDRRNLYIKILAEIRAIRGLDAPKDSKITLKTEVEQLIKTGDAKVIEGEGTPTKFTIVDSDSEVED